MCDVEQDAAPEEPHVWVPGVGRLCGICNKGPQDHPIPVDHCVGKELHGDDCLCASCDPFKFKRQLFSED